MLDHASEPEPLLDRLLSNPGWTRAIARTLVDDPHLAEDLAQDAALAALRQPPRHDANVGGWLRTVMVRRLRMRRPRRRRWRRGEVYLYLAVRAEHCLSANVCEC